MLQRLVKLLSDEKIQYALVGGYAVALHGAVRGTVDIDILVSLDEQTLTKVERVMGLLGLVSRIPIKAQDLAKFRAEYIEQRNLKVWTFVNANNPVELVDVMILYDIRDFDIEIKKTAIGEIPVVSVDGLIKMKLEAGRPQDLIDVEALRKVRRT